MILKKIEEYFLQCSDKKSIVIFVISTFLITLIVRLITNITFNIEETTNVLNNYESIVVFIIFGVMIAPIIETFLFQSLFFEFRTEKNHYFIIMLSSFIFALLHFFSYKSIVPLIGIFYSGLIFNFAYYIYTIKNSSPFWKVVIIHGSLNLISGSLAFLANYFLDL